MVCFCVSILNGITICREGLLAARVESLWTLQQLAFKQSSEALWASLTNTALMLRNSVKTGALLLPHFLQHAVVEIGTLIYYRIPLEFPWRDIVLCSGKLAIQWPVVDLMQSTPHVSGSDVDAGQLYVIVSGISTHK